MRKKLLMRVIKDFMLASFRLMYFDIIHLKKAFIMKWKCLVK